MRVSDQPEPARSDLKVALPASRAHELAAQPLACPTHPAHLPRWIADHQGECRHILCHHCACTDETIFAERVSADDGRIRADRGTAAYRRAVKLVLARHVGARIIDIGEDAAWTAEYIVGKLNTVIEGHIILDLTAIADP